MVSDLLRGFYAFMGEGCCPVCKQGKCGYLEPCNWYRIDGAWHRNSGFGLTLMLLQIIL